MVDMALMGGISNSLNVALNISKALLGIRDQAVIQEKVLELTSEIITAQQAAMNAITAQTALIDQIRTLEKKIMDMEAWGTEKQRYEFVKVSVWGTFAYVLKEEMAAGSPSHRICANCYDRGKKSVLQAQPRIEMGRRMHLCPECKTTIMMEG